MYSISFDKTKNQTIKIEISCLDYKKIIDGFRNKKNEISAKSRTDKEIVQNIMIEYKHQF